MGLRRRPAEGQSFSEYSAGAGRNRGVARNVQGIDATRLQILRADHRLCLYAGGRHGQRSSCQLPSPRGGAGVWRLAVPPSLPRSRAGLHGVPQARSMTKRGVHAVGASRAWQRMLSGRRLDLLGPSPLDIEIEDIAHGLARVARWNGQTSGAHIFSVAQHTLLVEAVARARTPRLGRAIRLAIMLHDAPEYVIGDMISPFKAVIGDTYKGVEVRLLAAIHLRFGLPARRNVETEALVKGADRGAAFLEATRLAGFGEPEARRFFGPPPKLSPALERDYLTPWPAQTAERRYRDRLTALIRA